MAVEAIQVNDIITVRKWPEDEIIRGQVSSVIEGQPAGWKGVYFEVLTGAYTGKRLFTFWPQILENISLKENLPEPLERIGENPFGFEEFLSPVDSAVMVRIPAGPFTRGNDFGQNWAAPQKKITLDEFSIDKYPVTVGQYRAFCESTGHKPPKWSDVEKVSPTDEHPMVCVTWEDASSYAAWAGKRLPTEAEWEKAARGRSGNVFPWGSTPPDQKFDNLLELAGRNAPILEPLVPEDKSPYGVCLLSTSVSQWCSDFFDPHYYQTSPSENPAGPESGERRVVRGHGWFATVTIPEEKSKKSDGESEEEGGQASGESATRQKYERELRRRLPVFSDELRLFIRSSAPPKLKSEIGGFRCARTLR